MSKRRSKEEAERFAKFFAELEKWMPEPPPDWQEKAKISRYDAIYEARIKNDRSK